MPSEAKDTMRKIANWLNDHGWQVYFNQKNKAGYATFHANSNRKPDLLIQKNNKNILIETKPGREHKDILDGYYQTIQYAGEYWTGQVNYHNPQKQQKLDDKLNIDAFLFATQSSLDGYLYNKEEGKEDYVEHRNDYLKNTIGIDEKLATHSITRLLWRTWDKGPASEYYKALRRQKNAEDVVLPSKPRVGALMAKIERHTRQVKNLPMAFLSSSKFMKLNKERYND